MGSSPENCEALLRWADGGVRLYVC